MENTEKLRFSPSSISAFTDCSYKFKLAYIDREVPRIKGGPYSCFGTAIHKAIGDFYKSEKFDDRNAVLMSWPHVFLQELNDKNLPLPEDRVEEFEKSGHDMLLKFYDRQLKDNLLVRPVFLEKKYKLECDNFIAVGILDIAYGTEDDLDVSDFKTNGKSKTKKEVDKDHQLTMYAWLYWKMNGKIPTRLGLHYVKLDKKVYTTRTLEDLENFGKFLEDFYGKIKITTDWIPNFSHCHWCDFRNQCSKHETQKIRLL